MGVLNPSRISSESGGRTSPASAHKLGNFLSLFLSLVSPPSIDRDGLRKG